MADAIMLFSVDVLQTGYAHLDAAGKYHASASCSLIRGLQNIIVDPGGAWEKDKILDALQELNLEPKSIDVVIGTHGHSDHIGNLNLFPHAKQCVSYDINVADEYIENELALGKPYVLVDGYIELLPLPGHTAQDISVIVKNAKDLGTVGISGDLFECEDDEGKWQECSMMPDIQIKNRERLKTLCDFIIPGHGPMFKVQEESTVK